MGLWGPEEEWYGWELLICLTGLYFGHLITRRWECLRGFEVFLRLWHHYILWPSWKSTFVRPDFLGLYFVKTEFCCQEKLVLMHIIILSSLSRTELLWNCEPKKFFLKLFFVILSHSKAKKYIYILHWIF